MTDNMKVNTLLVLEWGAYSDSGYTGPLRVTKEFNSTEVAALFRARWKPPQDHPDWTASPDHFIAWLAKEGYVEDADDVKRWYIGNYDFKPERPL